MGYSRNRGGFVVCTRGAPGGLESRPDRTPCNDSFEIRMIVCVIYPSTSGVQHDYTIHQMQLSPWSSLCWPLREAGEAAHRVHLWARCWRGWLCLRMIRLRLRIRNRKYSIRPITESSLSSSYSLSRLSRLSSAGDTRDAFANVLDVGQGAMQRIWCYQPLLHLQLTFGA